MTNHVWSRRYKRCIAGAFGGILAIPRNGVRTKTVNAA